MALIEIPTGILPEEIVETLPKVGEENKVYRRLVEDEALREMQITDDFIWYDGEYHEFSFDARIYGAYFERYQRSVVDTIANLETRIEALEGGGGTGIVLIDEPVAQMQGAEVQFLASVPEDIYIEGGDTVKAEITGLTFDGLANPTNIKSSVVVDYGYIRFANHDAIVQFDEFGDNKYIYLNVYNADGDAVNNPSCENLKVTLIKGVQ